MRTPITLRAISGLASIEFRWLPPSPERRLLAIRDEALVGLMSAFAACGRFGATSFALLTEPKPTLRVKLAE